MIRFTQGRKPQKSFEINFFLFLFSKLRWVVCFCVCVCGWAYHRRAKASISKFKKKRENLSCFFFLPQFLSFFKKLVGREKMSRVEWSLTEWKEKTNWTTDVEIVANCKKERRVSVLAERRTRKFWPKNHVT
jgi:hypothetical protein